VEVRKTLQVSETIMCRSIVFDEVSALHPLYLCRVYSSSSSSLASSSTLEVRKGRMGDRVSDR
jgi:hypothetical protein